MCVWQVACIALLVLSSQVRAQDNTETKEYMFPNEKISIHFPCRGKIDDTSTFFYEYAAFTANMQCNQSGLTYSAVYHAYQQLEGLEDATDEDIYYFLRQFRDMVREADMGDMKEFDLKDEKPTQIGNRKAITFSLVGNTKKTADLRVRAAVLLDDTNALYLSAAFVKDLEKKSDPEAFWNSVRVNK